MIVRKIIQNTGSHTTTPVTDQLDLLIEALRMHEHSVDIQPTPVVLGPILVRLCRESKDIAEHEDLTLRANPTRAVAMSDAVLLQAILRNLIRNAVKYTGPGGRSRRWLPPPRDPAEDRGARQRHWNSAR